MNEEIIESMPDAAVLEVEVRDEIVMDLTVTVDASESTVDLEIANPEVLARFEEDGFEATSESNYTLPHFFEYKLIM